MPRLSALKERGVTEHTNPLAGETGPSLTHNRKESATLAAERGEWPLNHTPAGGC